ncbi:MAG: mRNA surveillance protein pelota, partial [Methanobacteriota archaeon]
FRGATIEGTGQAGLAGVQEAIRRGMVDRIQKDARVVQETQLVEELLSRIAASGTAAYGPREALAAIEAGAAQTVLVTDELVRRGEGEAFLVAAKSSDARSFVVSTSHEAGAKLASLGGVGVLLRYQIV